MNKRAFLFTWNGIRATSLQSFSTPHYEMKDQVSTQQNTFQTEKMPMGQLQWSQWHKATAPVDTSKVTALILLVRRLHICVTSAAEYSKAEGLSEMLGCGIVD